MPATQSREDAGPVPGGCWPLARQRDTQVSHPSHRQGDGCVSPEQLLHQEQPQASEPSLIFMKSLLFTFVGRKEGIHPAGWPSLGAFPLPSSFSLEHPDCGSVIQFHE